MSFFFFFFNNPISSSICKLPIHSEIYNCTFNINTNKVSINIMIILLLLLLLLLFKLAYPFSANTQFFFLVFGNLTQEKFSVSFRTRQKRLRVLLNILSSILFFSLDLSLVKLILFQEEAMIRERHFRFTVFLVNCFTVNKRKTKQSNFS